MAKAVEKLAAVTSVPERKDVNFKLTDVTLIDDQDQQFNWNLMDALTSFQVALTISGASTVKPQFEDADYEFLNDPVFAKWAFGIQDVSQSSARTFSTHRITSATDNVSAGLTADMEWILGQRPIDLILDTIAFRLCGIQTQQTILTTPFEDKTASLLRDKRGFKTATRGKITRAAFVADLCKEAGVDYFIPEVDVKQPIAASPAPSVTPSTRSTGGAGITNFQGLTVKGVPLTKTQANIINTGLAVGVKDGAPIQALIAYVEALITENTVANPNPGNSADEGSLSLIASTAASTGINPFDVGAVADYFFTKGFAGRGGAISIARGNPGIHPFEIAQEVQGSGAGAATNGASNYGPWESEAQKIVAAFMGGKFSGSTTTTVAGPYAFTRGKNEDSWDCIQRLASEVAWYAFVRENRLWYVSGNYLFAQQPQLEVRRQTKSDKQSESDNGIDWVDVDLDVGARDQIAEVTVSGRTHLWTALPGMVVQVNKRGPANGPWIVSDVNLDILDDSNGCTITLQKPIPARPEPAAPRKTRTATTPSLLTGPSGSIQAAYTAALTLSNMKLPYLWGGGHQPGGLIGVHAGGPGLDCSGSTCYVLHQAGMFPSDTAIVSGDFGTWGSPGEGQEMTVWYTGGHVWIEFKLPGLHMQMNTVSPGDVGPRLYPYGPPGGNPAGFTPRQWTTKTTLLSAGGINLLGRGANPSGPGGHS